MEKRNPAAVVHYDMTQSGVFYLDTEKTLAAYWRLYTPKRGDHLPWADVQIADETPVTGGAWEETPLDMGKLFPSVGALLVGVTTEAQVVAWVQEHYRRLLP